MNEEELRKLIRRAVTHELGAAGSSEPVPDFEPTAPRERPDSPLSPEELRLAKKVAEWVGAEIPPPPWHGSWRAAGDRDYYVGRSPARLNVGHAGTRYRTPTILSFLVDHAAAKDAVHSAISPQVVEQLKLRSLSSAAEDKQSFLARPDLGRKLSEDSVSLVQQHGVRSPQVQIVAGDGLSAAAINVNLPKILPPLLAEFRKSGIRVGLTFAIDNCRVACGDQVARLVDAEVLCMLVGERPGLKTAESMGAYVTYMKVKDFNEAMRSVVSNIHSGGLLPETDGARQVAELCMTALKERRTGVGISL